MANRILCELTKINVKNYIYPKIFLMETINQKCFWEELLATKDYNFNIVLSQQKCSKSTRFNAKSLSCLKKLMELAQTQFKITYYTVVISKPLIRFAVSIVTTQSIPDMLLSPQGHGCQPSRSLETLRWHTTIVLQVSHCLSPQKAGLWKHLFRRAGNMDGHPSEMRRLSGKMSDVLKTERLLALMEHI